nr:energy-coupling factor ABC transporter ATP-binding protein [uncultured Schaedlerella sp.]
MIELKNVCFTYAGGQADAGIKNIELTVSQGEVILLCGCSGCGKTTVTRLINGLIPHYYEGELSGTAKVLGHTVSETPLYETARSVGSVFQNPRSQFFNVDTDSELAFACENLGMPEQEVRKRVRRAVRELSLEPLSGRSIFELSGGEKQKIACGSVSALNPDIIVLDEPTSNLDTEGIRSLRSVIKKWKEQKKTIVIAEHRLHFMSGIADRVLYMKDGTIAEEYRAEDFFEQPAFFYTERGLRIPNFALLPQMKEGTPDGNGTCTLENVHYSYKSAKTVLDIPKLQLPVGKATAVIGKNGAGKTTLMRSICGLLKHDKSVFELNGIRYGAKKRLSVCYQVMQDVNHQLFTESVLDEVLLSMKHEDEGQAERILSGLDLSRLKELHPMSLSGGQKQRVAIASALAADRPMIIFDEPTSGLDFWHMNQVADHIKALMEKDKTVFIVTHDPEFIMACCDYILYLEQGKVQACFPLDEKGTQRMKDFFEIDGR